MFVNIALWKSLKMTFNSVIILILVTLLGSVFLLSLQNFRNMISESPIFTDSPSSAEKSPFCDDHDSLRWHPVAKKDSQGRVICVYGHEHGDPPPQWLTDAGYSVGFSDHSGFMANTSGMENSQKHPGMKGFSTVIKGVDVYARIHLASNPLDRGSRFHSYELFLKDQSGNTSHFQGWLDSGDPNVDRIAYRDSTALNGGKDPGNRPIVWAASRQACLVDQLWCAELWTMRTSPWGPDLIWGINDSTSYYHPQEELTEDISKWDLSGKLGVDRSLTVTIYRDPEKLKQRGVDKVPVGEVWATQFGDIVSGPDDPQCHQMIIKYGVNYPVICLKNYLAPTLPQITGAGNTSQKIFESTGVKVPN